MKYTNIKRVIAGVMLSAFILPFSGVSMAAYDSYNPYDSYGGYNSGLTLTGNAGLTDINQNITLSLRDSDVKQVIRMFADKAGKNVIFHSSVSGKVTMDLVDTPINDAFNLVLEVAGLRYYVQNNTLIVLAKGSEDNANFAKQEMMLFPINYITAQKIADFLNSNVFNEGAETATVNAATNEVIVFGMPSSRAIVQKVIDQLDREPLSRTFAVSHTTPAEMADMICNMLLPSRGADSNKSSSGGKGGYAPPTPGVMGGAAGIVTGGAAGSSGGSTDIKLGEGVIACTVSQSANGSGKGASAGFDMQNLSVSYFPQRGTVMIMGGSEAQANMIERFIKTNDIRQPQAYLEMSIVELNEDGTKVFNNEWSVNTKNFGFGFPVLSEDGRTSTGTAGGFGTSNSGDLIPVKVYKADEPGPGGKLVDDYKTRRELYGGKTYIKWTMQYLITNGKGRVLANPKLLITNGQESVIDLTQDYVEKVTTQYRDNQGAMGNFAQVQKTYTIGEDLGIKITLTPFISPDGYVTMNIKPEYSVKASDVTDKQSDDLVATLLARRNLDLKNLRVKDGETLVIGGLIQEAETKTVAKVPVLGDLPIIGAAFRSTRTGKQKSELIIMLTPRILTDNDEVADNL